MHASATPAVDGVSTSFARNQFTVSFLPITCPLHVVDRSPSRRAEEFLPVSKSPGCSDLAAMLLHIPVTGRMTSKVRMVLVETLSCLLSRETANTRDRNRVYSGASTRQQTTPYYRDLSGVSSTRVCLNVPYHQILPKASAAKIAQTPRISQNKL